MKKSLATHSSNVLTAKLSVSVRPSKVAASAARRCPLPVVAAPTIMVFFVVVKEKFPSSS